MSRFANGYERIAHFHLAKTGGTSINSWLDTLTHSSAARPAHEGYVFLSNIVSRGVDNSTAFKELGRRSSNWWTIVHDHCPGILTPSLNTYKLIFIREPIKRFVSQISDYRRLSQSDITGVTAEQNEFITAARELDINQLIAEYSDHPEFLRVGSNYQTRLLAEACEYTSAHTFKSNFAAAKWLVTEGVNFVGITERMDDCLAIICRDLGVVPQHNFPKTNVNTNSESYGLDISEGSSNTLIELNQEDISLYATVKTNLDARQLKQPYSENDFQKTHIHNLLRFARPTVKEKNDSLFFDVEDQIIGRGYYGRDATRTENSQVWLGPGNSSLIYMPVPSNEVIAIRLYIMGYMNNEIRSSIKINIDGKERPILFLAGHKHECHEIIEILCKTKFDYVKIEIKTNKCITSEETAGDFSDNRPRSLSLKGYGYKFISLDKINFFKEVLPDHSNLR